MTETPHPVGADTIVFVGTYTQDILFGTGAVLKGKGEGIYVFSLDRGTGRLTRLRTETGIVNPSYLCLSPDGRFLYAVNELKEYEGLASGSVSAFSVDPRNFALTLLNRMPTGGTDPCHVAVNDAGTHIFVSNFMSGSVNVFPIREDGRLGASSCFIQHEGSGVDPKRQAGPHAHSLTLDPKNAFAFVPDLGLDRVMAYRFDQTAGILKPNSVPFIGTAPGAGPRHFEFHPGGRHAFLINELASTLTSYAYDGKNGVMRAIQTVSTVPASFKGSNTCADLHIAPSGRFIYGSNRGHDSIVIYAVDEASGRLGYLGHEPSGGRTPRNFAIDPSGGFLLAANQDDDSIVTFRIDRDTGRLEKVHETGVPTPVCVKTVVRDRD